MKKLLAIIITALVLVAVIAVPVTAARNAKQSNYVDADNNGICDNRAESCPAQSTGKNCNRTNYADAYNSGICDNRPANGRGQGAHCKGNR